MENGESEDLRRVEVSFRHISLVRDLLLRAGLDPYKELDRGDLQTADFDIETSTQHLVPIDTLSIERDGGEQETELSTEGVGSYEIGGYQLKLCIGGVPIIILSTGLFGDEPESVVFVGEYSYPPEDLLEGGGAYRLIDRAVKTVERLNLEGKVRPKQSSK